ncbi:hypothetical protein ANTQUA_LOCUS1058 [Anthophora quadrimaculata]
MSQSPDENRRICERISGGVLATSDRVIIRAVRHGTSRGSHKTDPLKRTNSEQGTKKKLQQQYVYIFTGQPAPLFTKRHGDEIAIAWRVWCGRRIDTKGRVERGTWIEVSLASETTSPFTSHVLPDDIPYLFQMPRSGSLERGCFDMYLRHPREMKEWDNGKRG